MASERKNTNFKLLAILFIMFFALFIIFNTLFVFKNKITALEQNKADRVCHNETTERIFNDYLKDSNITDRFDGQIISQIGEKTTVCRLMWDMNQKALLVCHEFITKTICEVK